MANSYKAALLYHFEINRQCIWVVFCTHVPDRFLSVQQLPILFASLSHAALETWLTVLTKAGEGIYAVLNVLNQIQAPPWIIWDSAFV